MATDYSKHTVVQLKKLATERGISAALKSGLRKADIIEKLEEFDADMPAQEAPVFEPAPGTDEQVLEAPAIVNGATVDSVSGVQAGGEPSNEPVAPPHHEPILPVAQEGPLLAPAVDEPPLPEPIAEVQPLPEPTSEAPVPSAVPATKAEAETSKAEVVPPTTQTSSDLNTPVPAEDIQEDNRKRKRRSVTPPVVEAEVTAKRQKQEENVDTDAAVSDAPPQIIESIEVEEQAGSDKAVEQAEPVKEEEAGRDTTNAEAVQEAPAEDALVPTKIPTGPRQWSRDSLFNKKQTNRDTKAEDDDEKDTAPAIHHATAALYIRGFQRPLQLPALERHLISLASPPSANSDSNVVKSLHLDQVKTHALVLFSSISAASRVRSSLHGRVWPNESARKELWVDFIPEEKVLEWIDKENQNNAGRTGGRRWEVVYIPDEEGAMEAVHQEEGSNHAPATRQPSSQGLAIKGSAGPPPNAPLGPRSSLNAARPSISQATGPAPGTIPPSQTSTFKTLDQLFHSTTAKPMIYWEPVAKPLAEKRKDEFKHETGRDWTPAKWKDEDELFRYSFEGGHRIVHSGPHNTSSRVRRREEEIVGARRGGRGGGEGGGRGWNRNGGGDRAYGYGRR